MTKSNPCFRNINQDWSGKGQGNKLQNIQWAEEKTSLIVFHKVFGQRKEEALCYTGVPGPRLIVTPLSSVGDF